MTAETLKEESADEESPAEEYPVEAEENGSESAEDDAGESSELVGDTVADEDEDSSISLVASLRWQSTSTKCRQ